ncbi:MAG: citrate/2-methylcitrate synthase, partial [Candidatus Omnitrophica bacterium]|nr:citrate/2-methylcitrate synthase [Candidatus Omnitrophota bacterium]
MTTASSSPVVSKGLEGVVVSETKVSDVDGARCQLIYRGYHIDELVGKATYEDVSYLLLTGRLPTRQEQAEWSAELVHRRPLSPDLFRVMQQLPFGNPMASLRTMVSIMGLADGKAESLDPASLREQAWDLIAKAPTIVALFERLRSKRPMLGPRPDLSHAANILYMLHGETPSPLHAAALDAYLVLLAEHGFNASTFSARTTVATQSDFYSGIVSALGTLKAP